MELLQGEDLDVYLRRTPRVPIERMAFILRQVCSALQAAHARGVVHRDLKPANIFLCSNKVFEDFVVVLDFGISKILGSDSVHTQTAAVIGTPFYMSPEMAEGRHSAVGPSADIFALGSIMYQILGGCPPFAGDSLPGLLYKIVHEEPAPLRTVRPDVPEALEAVVVRAMRKAPEERFPSSSALSAALLEAVPGSGLIAGAAGERQRDGDPARSASSADPSVAQHLPETLPPAAVTLKEQPPAPAAEPPTIVASPPGEETAALARVSKRWRVALVAGGATVLLTTAGVVTWRSRSAIPPAETEGTKETARLARPATDSRLGHRSSRRPATTQPDAAAPRVARVAPTKRPGRGQSSADPGNRPERKASEPLQHAISAVDGRPPDASAPRPKPANKDRPAKGAQIPPDRETLIGP